MPQHPLAEVFGFPTDKFSPDAIKHRSEKLCPFNNKVPACTKNSKKNPLGVCSVFENGQVVITCPVRFRQDWLIIREAANFFFPPDVPWTYFTECPILDKQGETAGHIDIVLVSYDSSGTITDFGAIEVQAVYISGNVGNPFNFYMENPSERYDMDWTREALYPHPDYLSSTRKRLAPQLLYKGSMYHQWGKKQVVIVDDNLFKTLPKLEEVAPDEAEMAWMIYDVQRDPSQDQYKLQRVRTVYTDFTSALDTLTKPEIGDIELFQATLQEGLSVKLGKPGKRRRNKQKVTTTASPLTGFVDPNKK